MKNSFGIYENSFNLIIQCISEIKEVETAVIFGSRSMGNYKKGSDVDIAVTGQSVNSEIISRLSAKINQDLPVPYYVDIINYFTINNPKLKQHIDVYGKVIYRRSKIWF